MNTNKVAEIQITYKNPIAINNRQRVRSSKDIYKTILETWDRGVIELREEFKILLLNRANEVLGFYHLSTGGLCGTIQITQYL